MNIFSLLTLPADFVTFELLQLDSGTRAAEAVRFFIEDTLKIFLLLFVISFLVSFIRTFLPPERVRRILLR